MPTTCLYNIEVRALNCASLSPRPLLIRWLPFFDSSNLLHSLEDTLSLVRFLRSSGGAVASGWELAGRSEFAPSAGSRACHRGFLEPGLKPQHDPGASDHCVLVAHAQPAAAGHQGAQEYQLQVRARRLKKGSVFLEALGAG